MAKRKREETQLEIEPLLSILSEKNDKAVIQCSEIEDANILYHSLKQKKRPVYILHSGNHPDGDKIDLTKEKKEFEESKERAVYVSSLF